jgi:hypothetical protein
MRDLERPSDVHALSRFMEYFNPNLAREVVRLTSWTDKVWARGRRPSTPTRESGGDRHGYGAALSQWHESWVASFGRLCQFCLKQ